MKLQTQDRIEQLGHDVQDAAPYLVSDEKSSTLKLTERLDVDAQTEKKNPPKWVHFIAGGVGGMLGAVVTCPLDVVKTRLQSDSYHTAYNKTPKSQNPLIKGGAAPNGNAPAPAVASPEGIARPEDQ